VRFCLRHSVQTASWAHLAFHQMGTRVFPREKFGRGLKLTTHLNLGSRLTMCRAIYPLPHYVSIAWCLIKRLNILQLVQQLNTDYHDITRLLVINCFSVSPISASLIRGSRYTIDISRSIQSLRFLVMQNVKIKISLSLIKQDAMNTHWGSKGIVPCILDLGTRLK
jgi:hypothetical protein